MRAILINTETQTINEMEFPKGADAWKQISKTIGNGCTLFECPITFDNGDTIYCDEEGLYNEYKGGIMMDDWHTPLVGNVLILGSTSSGRSNDAKSDVNELRSKITFLTRLECEMMFLMRSN